MDFHDRDSLSKEIGKRLSKARNDADLTQAQAADHLTRMGFRNNIGEAIGASLVANWEQGIRTPRDLRQLMALADLYRVSYAWLLCAPDAPQDQQERTLLAKYRGTDERGKRMIQGIADTQPVYSVGQEREDEKDGTTR